MNMAIRLTFTQFGLLQNVICIENCETSLILRKFPCLISILLVNCMSYYIEYSDMNSAAFNKTLVFNYILINKSNDKHNAVVYDVSVLLRKPILSESILNHLIHLETKKLKHITNRYQVWHS